MNKRETLQMIESDEVLKGLRTRYFELYALENIGKTMKRHTVTLDDLELSIKKRIIELTHAKPQNLKDSPKSI